MNFLKKNYSQKKKPHSKRNMKDNISPYDVPFSNNVKFLLRNVYETYLMLISFVSVDQRMHLLETEWK